MQPMQPFRAKMIRQRQLARLAPRTPDASVEAVAGLAKCSWGSPARLTPEQSRDSLHQLLVERQLAWSACNQSACGRKFCSLKTSGWEVLRLHLPPRKGRSQRPQVLSLEELARLFRRPNPPKHRVFSSPSKP